jgi:DNA polymerase I
MPENLVNQMETLKSLLVKTNIPYIQIVNYEADDIIASFIVQTAERHPNLIFDIFTRDKDMLQLINQNTNILKYINGKITLYNQESFQQEYNFLPSSYVDYLSLLGDNVDNIEGVKGIGPVNAKILIRQFSTLENIYQKISECPSQSNIPEPIKILLEKGQELVLRNKKIIGLEKNISLFSYSSQKYDFS